MNLHTVSTDRTIGNGRQKQCVNSESLNIRCRFTFACKVQCGKHELDEVMKTHCCVAGQGKRVLDLTGGQRDAKLMFARYTQYYLDEQSAWTILSKWLCAHSMTRTDVRIKSAGEIMQHRFLRN